MKLIQLSGGLIRKINNRYKVIKYCDLANRTGPILANYIMQLRPLLKVNTGLCWDELTCICFYNKGEIVGYIAFKQTNNYLIIVIADSVKNNTTV